MSARWMCQLGRRSSEVFCTHTYIFAPPPPPPPNLPSVAPPPPPPPREATSSATNPGDNNNRRRSIIIGVAGSVAIAIVIVIVVCIWLVTRKKHGRVVSGSSRQENIEDPKPLLFDLNEIRAATDNFADANKLGQGGFGPVYKGKLSDGHEIAVKRLLASSSQDITELRNEVASLAKLQHRNLVKLLGCCLEYREKLLIYEFVPNSEAMPTPLLHGQGHQKILETHQYLRVPTETVHPSQ